MTAIKETKEMMAFVLSLANATGKSVADGKVGITDLVHFLAAINKAAPAFSGATAIPGELVDLDDAEKQELKEFVTAEFDIPQDSLEPIIERGMHIAVDLMEILKFFAKG